MSYADREQVIDVLKAAFVQGRLPKAELDLRVGQVLASLTYADLAALTADIPAGPARVQPLEPARESDKVPAPKTIARVAAAGTGVSMVFTGAELMRSGGNPVTGLVAVGLTGFLAAVLIAGFLLHGTVVSARHWPVCGHRIDGGPSCAGTRSLTLATDPAAGHISRRL
jgi:hypothetical protein